MTIPHTIETSVGTVDVFHRLALGVVLRDALTSRVAPSAAPRVGREAHARLLPRHRSEDWPCLDLERLGEGRYRLRHGSTVGAEVTLRLGDRSRRYVPRRMHLALWPLADVADPDPAHYVPVASRTLNVWLSPGSAYPLPRGATAIRGRVVHGEAPVRWTRLTARDTNGVLLGQAMGDDRGEFLLPLTRLNQNPMSSTVVLSLFVEGPADPTPPDGVTTDPLSDLPVEDVPRAAVPTHPGDLDGPLLRGRLTPPAYVPNTAATPQYILPVGAELVPDEPVQFDP